MKKIRVILCFAISFVMVMTMTGMTASAMEGVDDPDEGTIAEESGGDEYAMGIASGPQYPAYGGPTISKVTNIKKYPGYGRVKLTWKAAGPKVKVINDVSYGGKDGKVTETIEYVIYRNGEKRWTTNNLAWEHYKNVKMYKVYTYKIKAVKKAKFEPYDGSAATDIKPAVATATTKGQCVRKMKIKIRAKKTRYLTSKDGKGKKLTVKAGSTLWSDAYGSGCYYFNRKGASFRISNANARALKADYAKKGDYTRPQAEYFINGYVKENKVANKKYLIWVSTYHQRLYVFQKKNGKWKCVRDWNVSTGKMSTPSPTGKKKIRKKVRSRHNISWWNPYSSWNSLHGVRSNWGSLLGTIRSAGCIRNKTSNAKWIYYNCKIGTTVLVY